MEECVVCLILLGFLLVLGGCISSNPGLILSQDVNRTIIGGDINTFLDLNDTADSYMGFALDCVVVNSDENGLIFSGFGCIF